MSWEQVLGHEKVLERFKASARRGRIASTYLFVGPEGIGKRTFALKLAQAIMCENSSEQDLEACGSCPACLQVTAKTHPDVILVSKPRDKNTIPVETFIGDREHRRQRGLCHDIGLKPFNGGRRFAIIDDADCLNAEGANSLLKTLEEPPPKSILVLIGTSEQRQLQTIVSRSQVIRFNALTTKHVAEILKRENLLGDESDVELDLDVLAGESAGSVSRALQLADPDFLQFRQTLYRQLATLDPGQDSFAKAIVSFVEAAGKESSEKRQRLAGIADSSIAFFRELMCVVTDPSNVLSLSQHSSSVRDVAKTAIETFRENGFSDPDIEHACADCIGRTLNVQYHVSANATPPNVVASWLRDLGMICRREHAFEMPLY